MKKKIFYKLILNFIFFISTFNSHAKILNFYENKEIDYKILEQDQNKFKTYLVDKIEFQGLKNLDEELVRSFINIKEKKSINIPSPTIKENIEKLLACDFIEHVACFISFVDDIHVNLIFKILEFPIIEEYNFIGITKKQQNKLIDKVKFSIKRPASNKYLNVLKEKIKKFYVEAEGCKLPEVDFKFIYLEKEKSEFKIVLEIILPPIKKTFINKINFFGNENINDYFIKPELILHEKPKFTLFKDILYKIITLQPLKKDGYLRAGYTGKDFLRYFKNNVIFIPRKKFNAEELRKDKQKILNVFSEHGYNDAEILKTKIKYYKSGRVDLDFFIDEGEKFYINSIKCTGNLKYETKFLNKILKLKKGDIFSLSQIKDKIYGPNGISSLYQDLGFLMSSIEPVIVGVNGNKVDLEIRISEGDIYKINEVGIVGNTFTFDEIIRRKLYVQPGDVFSRSDIMLSIQSLAMSDLFDMKNINPTPVNINKKNKTTDIIFNVKESPKFKVEGGVSSAMDENNAVKFNLGLKCNNVSIVDILKFQGLLGGGQNFNLGYHFFSLKKHSIDFAFDNPFLTNGKYPWGYDFGIDFTFDNEEKQASSSEKQSLNEFSLGMGFFKQLPWENGSSKIYFKPNYKYYDFENNNIIPSSSKIFTGNSHEITCINSFVRNTQDDIFFPKKGNNFSFNFTTTPPYGWFKKFDNEATLLERLKFRDFGSILIEDDQYFQLWNDFVFMLRFKHGQSFSYSDELISNKFALGGGIANKIVPYGILSLKNVPLRGYSDNQFKLEQDIFGAYGGKFFDLFSSELRWLVFDFSAMFKLFILGFFDAGILYNDLKSFDVENLKKSIGFGFRVLLPQFGVLGIDWGYGIDNEKQNQWEFHFQIGI